jgi:cellulose synthase/poly-beta-1,6-N-acetylglucosamine synthase-like glycosyltransferase
MTASGNQRLEASVCICTYNGAERIPLVLAALARQDCSPGDWEILIVDSSTDDSRSVAEKECARLLGSRARVISENRPGLSFARERAAREAHGDIICFLDDDNIPEPDFVTQAIRAFKAHPHAGCLGGKVIPRWECTPTPLAEAVADFVLAICDRGDRSFAYEGVCGGPVGAGMSVRRDLLQQVYREPRFAQTTVGGTALDVGGGEDTAISVVIKRMNWEIWYVPALVLYHLIPPARMTKDYFLRYYARIGRGQASVRLLHDWKARTPIAWLIGLKDFCRWQLGQWRGPSPALRHQHPALAGDLHELHQSMTLNRARQALAWPR